MKIALGTAQFGMNYGISNHTGRVKYEEAEKILDLARSAGVDTIDTAPSYGDSENVLGSLGVRDFRVVSKIPNVSTQFRQSRSWLLETVELSLKNLNLDILDVLLFHNPSDILQADSKDLIDQALDLKDRGYIKKLGYSIYSPEELDQLTAVLWPDCLQGPINLFDRRLSRSGWLEKLRKKDTEIHARSVFLQGALLQAKCDRGEVFDHCVEIFRKYDDWIETSGLTRVRAAINFLLQLVEVDRIVVGVETAKQLAEILQVGKDTLVEVPEDFATDDEKLINPSKWLQ